MILLTAVRCGKVRTRTIWSLRDYVMVVCLHTVVTPNRNFSQRRLAPSLATVLRTAI